LYIRTIAILLRAKELTRGKVFFLFFNLRLDSKDEADDETVEGKSLSENENKNHTDEETRLLRVGADTSITDNTNRHSGGETRETDSETSTEVSEALEGGVCARNDSLTDENSNNQTVDTNNCKPINNQG
jgi:hypothetical protein